MKGEEKNPEEITVLSTHRGPVLSADIIGKNLVHFENTLPFIDAKSQYSIAWGGNNPGDSLLKF